MENEKVLWSVASGRTSTAHKMDCGLFEKELLRVGRWVHPAKKFVLEVTRERMKKWVESFNDMLKAGIRVPVPYGHSYDPRDNAGFLIHMYTLGDMLIGRLEIPREEDVARLGSVATDVSVSINPDFVDGKGQRFGEVIEHVAITNYPVVAGQTNFVALEDADGRRILALEKLPNDTAAPSDSDVSDLDRRGDSVSRPASQPDGLADETEGSIAATLTPAPLPEGEGTATAGSDTETTDVSQWSHADRDALVARISRLEEERVDREVESLLLEGRISPAVEGSVRRLLSAGDRLQLSATGESISPAEELRAILACVPVGAWVPLSRRAAAAQTLSRRETEMSAERAEELAKGNAQLLWKGGTAGNTNA
jgi:hypothetical protein